MLKDLDVAARKSGLRVVELPGWESNKSNGGEDYQGVLVHHTGSYDGIADAKSDRDYAMWMAFEGRSDLPPPLDNLALSAESVVYVSAAGNANHAGRAKASGPMPQANDGNRIYIGIEAMNSGSQGWNTVGRDASGVKVTQYEGYVRLCAALCLHYGWPASHVRAHRETSYTGKPDPGGINMDKFRLDIAAEINRMNGDDDVAYTDWPKADKDALVADLAKAILGSPINVKTVDGKAKQVTVRQAIARAANSTVAVKGLADEIDGLNR